MRMILKNGNPHSIGPRSKMRSSSKGDVELFAQPYDVTHSGRGFYFDSLAAYEAKYDENYRKFRIEEYEIQFIDGDRAAQKIFEALQVSQGTIAPYFDTLAEIGNKPADVVAFLFLLDTGRDPAEAFDKIEDVMVFEGTPGDAAYQELDDLGGPDKELAERYFDYEQYGYDLRISGDLTNELQYELEEAQRDGDVEREGEIQEQLDHIESLSDSDLAYETIEGIGSLRDAVGEAAMSRYFDYDAYARDNLLNSDWAEETLDGTDYVILNASSL